MPGRGRRRRQERPVPSPVVAFDGMHHTGQVEIPCLPAGQSDGMLCVLPKTEGWSDMIHMALQHGGGGLDHPAHQIPSRRGSRKRLPEPLPDLVGFPVVPVVKEVLAMDPALHGVGWPHVTVPRGVLEGMGQETGNIAVCGHRKTGAPERGREDRGRKCSVHQTSGGGLSCTMLIEYHEARDAEVEYGAKT